MVYQTIWDKKFTEETKCLSLSRITIHSIQKEIERINSSDKMAVVATMLEPIPDVRIKSKKDEDKWFRAYDALIFYVKKKEHVMKDTGEEVFKKKEEEQTTADINAVDLD